MQDVNVDYSDIIEVVTCKSSKEFIETLRRSNVLFARGHSSPFVFRGHEDVDYELIPSLFRPDASGSEAYMHWYDYYRDFSDTVANDTDTSEQKFLRHSKIIVRIENQLLTDFAIKSNKIGLSVPELEKALINNKNEEFHNCSPQAARLQIATRTTDKRRLPLYAGLAQHHGVRTRLLDFTYNPQKAIFFAVKNGKSSAEWEEKYICVWAFPLEAFEDSWLDKLGDDSEMRNGSHIFSRYSTMLMATSINDYLYRQEGLFLYPVFPHEFRCLFNRYPSVLDYLRYMSSDTFPRLKVYKIVLPAQYVGEVKRLLTLEGITLASLMPTFDNVRLEMDQFPFKS